MKANADPIELRFSVDPTDMPNLQGPDVERWLLSNPVFMCPGCGSKILLEPEDVQETIRWGVSAGDAVRQASRKCPSCGEVYFAARVNQVGRGADSIGDPVA